MSNDLTYVHSCFVIIKVMVHLLFNGDQQKNSRSKAGEKLLWKKLEETLTNKFFVDNFGHTELL